MEEEIGMRVIELANRAASGFDEKNWLEVGLLTGQADAITGHRRLLRSLDFGDSDYEGCVVEVLWEMTKRQPKVLKTIETYLDEHFPGESTYISAKPRTKKITFAPGAFEVPTGGVEIDLCSVMMPFSSDFDKTHAAIKKAAEECRFRCVRADDIWDESALIQDIFSLIYRSQVVVVDFSDKNPNVMYETGIAHTLGKIVVPITRSLDDVPFDLRHHRALRYLPNDEGLGSLSSKLEKKLRQFAVPQTGDHPEVPF